jgi:DNA repair exonuclease SbcCD nuclease subunit
MKILFTADVHIKLGQKNVPVEWSRNRFRLFCEQFSEMQHSADLVIVGGDVFDRLPTMDEVELYFDFVESFHKPTLIYPGNHEMLKKDSTFLTNLKKSTHRLNPLVSLVDDYYENASFSLDVIPYNKLKDYEKHGRQFSGRILCTHVRGEIPPHVKPEVDLDIFASWDVVLAGDLHSYENSQRNILYPGSPYTTSFHRSRVDTGAILLDASSLEHTWLKFNLPQLIKRTIAADETPVATDFDHTVYEVQGDMQELGELADSELIATKVLKRDTDSALMLDAEMTLNQEVREYVTYILELPETTVDKVLQEMQNHAEKFT